MDRSTLKIEITDGCAWLTLSQPDRLNSITPESARELRDAVSAIGRDPNVRVLVLAGEGRAFCAGGDVAQFHAHLGDAPAFLDRLVETVHEIINDLLVMPKPVIASVGGVVAGGGMALFMAADLAIAAESATFVMAYSGIGASPDGGSTFFLPRLVGSRRALELVLTNRRLSAAEALEWGLVNQVVPDGGLAGAVKELALRLAQGPTLAFSQARALVRQSFANTAQTQLDLEKHGLIAMAGTADFREGVTAFVEKRRPSFKGR